MWQSLVELPLVSYCIVVVVEDALSLLEVILILPIVPYLALEGIYPLSVLLAVLELSLISAKLVLEHPLSQKLVIKVKLTLVCELLTILVLPL